MSEPTFESSKTICCIGAGYVGGCTFAVIASRCPSYKVIVCDIDEKRIAQWNSDELPIFEPQLEETIKEAQTKNKNLFFTSDVAGSIKVLQLKHMEEVLVKLLI